MTTVTDASLTDAERQAVERFLDLLRGELGDELLAVWLFGSRARGERPRPESDVDLMVITPRGTGDLRRVSRLAVRAELAGPPGVDLAAHVWDPQHLEGRRAIRSFFVQELDRDKIVLHGNPGL